MNEYQQLYWSMVSEYEYNVLGFQEKVGFRDRLNDIINNHSDTLSSDELASAKRLLDRIQKEINHI